MPIIPATWEAGAGESFKTEAEVAVGQDCATETPAWAKKQNSVSKKKKCIQVSDRNKKELQKMTQAEDRWESIPV